MAKMHLLCEDEGVIGSAFYLMAEVQGRNFDDPRLEALSRPERGAVMDEMNRVLAAIHEVDIAAASLGDYGPEGDYYARQVGRWTKQYRATQTEDLPDMDALIGWLEGNMPAEDGQRCLVYGDFRLDNLLFAPGGTQCVAVLDWELSTIGHPYADLAAVIMQWGDAPWGRRGGGWRAWIARRRACGPISASSRPTACAGIWPVSSASDFTSPFATFGWLRSFRG